VRVNVAAYCWPSSMAPSADCPRVPFALGGEPITGFGPIVGRWRRLG
jgi:hypothetical protein